ncbi:MAG: hypothetical protein RR522_04740 [Alistipes sp.]
MIKIFASTIAALLLFGTTHITAQTSTQPTQTPRLVVQIVVSSMRAEDINRYAANFGKGGLLRLREGGVSFTATTTNKQQPPYRSPH